MRARWAMVAAIMAGARPARAVDDATSAPPPQSAPAKTEAAPSMTATQPASQTPVQAGSGTAADTPPPAQPWKPPKTRTLDGVPMLGPWPDAWRPEDSHREGLPVVDIVTGDVLDPGHPYGAGPMLGPFPEAGAGTSEPPPNPVEGASAPTVERSPSSSSASGAMPKPIGTPPPRPGTPPSSGPTAPTVPVGPEFITHSILPMDRTDATPPGGLGRGVAYAMLALLALLAARGAERLGRRVASRGLLPILLGAIIAAGRGSAVGLLALTAFALAPAPWRWTGPFAIVAFAIALGWSLRDLLADLLAGAILAVERPLQVGDRVETATHQGRVAHLGLRCSRLNLDDGRVLTIPNHQLFASHYEVDPDGYAPVVVPVHVRCPDHLHATWTRQTLEELALLSPYIAPSRPPRAWRDPDRADVWIVRARIIHARYADAFRGALVELADEVFRTGRGRAPHLPALDQSDVAKRKLPVS